MKLDNQRMMTPHYLIYIYLVIPLPYLICKIIMELIDNKIMTASPSPSSDIHFFVTPAPYVSYGIYVIPPF